MKRSLLLALQVACLAAGVVLLGSAAVVTAADAQAITTATLLDEMTTRLVDT